MKIPCAGRCSGIGIALAVSTEEAGELVIGEGIGQDTVSAGQSFSYSRISSSALIWLICRRPVSAARAACGQSAAVYTGYQTLTWSINVDNNFTDASWQYFTITAFGLDNNSGLETEYQIAADSVLVQPYARSC